MPFAPHHPVCWTEIPVTDMDRARRFYETVFDWQMVENAEGPNPVLFFPSSDPASGIAGHIYPGTPSQTGPTIHLVVPDTLAAARTRCADAGGTVHDGTITIGAGSFCYAQDPEGNSIGLFQPKAP